MWISKWRLSLFDNLLTSRKYLEGMEWSTVGLPKFLSALELLTLSPYKDEAGKNTIIWYQSAIAAFIRLSINFWPDLAYSVRVLSQFCRDPWLVHVKLVKNVLWYKSGTIDLGLNFEGRADTLDDGCSWLGWLWFCRVKTWSKIDWKIYLYACNGCN